MQHLV